MGRGRGIILHADGVGGWVGHADLIFRSKTISADYHDEMNGGYFMEWLTDTPLTALDGPTVITWPILDNAAYHKEQKDISNYM